MNIYIIFFITIMSLISGAVLYRLLAKKALRNKLTRRVHRAIAGEKHAREYLIRNGFKIVGEQVIISPEMIVDGLSESFVLRVDFVAFKNGRKAIIDAKSGPKAADPCNPDTRRRMFEYLHYYNVQDVYIFDDVNKQLRHVKFVNYDDRRRFRYYLIWGTLLGIILTIIGQFIFRY